MATNKPNYGWVLKVKYGELWIANCNKCAHLAQLKINTHTRILQMPSMEIASGQYNRNRNQTKRRLGQNAGS